MTSLPEPLQGLYDRLEHTLRVSAADPGDFLEALMVLDALVAPYLTAQEAYAAGNGLYSHHPAFHVRIKGERAWTNWPDDKPVPTVLDLLMLAHTKKSDPAESQEDV